MSNESSVLPTPTLLSNVVETVETIDNATTATFVISIVYTTTVLTGYKEGNVYTLANASTEKFIKKIINKEFNDIKIQTLKGTFLLSAEQPSISLIYLNDEWRVYQYYVNYPKWIPYTLQTSGLNATGYTDGFTFVALSADGNTFAASKSNDNGNIGATWVFTRSGSTWTQQGNKLVGTGYAFFPSQGTALALSADGNTLAIGGSVDNNGGGAVWVFTRSGTTWTQQGNKLVGTGAVGGSVQGYSASLSADGDTLAVGGENDDNGIGATWIYTRSGSTWTQQGNKLVGTDAGSYSAQGFSVSLSANGNVLAVGGVRENVYTPAFWVFTRSGSTWSQQGSRNDTTDALEGGSAGANITISADGNTIILSEVTDDDRGAFWVFKRSFNTWSQLSRKIQPSTVEEENEFAAVVRMSSDGKTIIASCRASPAKVFIFSIQNDNIKLINTIIGDADYHPRLGISSDGKTLVTTISNGINVYV